MPSCELKKAVGELREKTLSALADRFEVTEAFARRRLQLAFETGELDSTAFALE